MLSQGVLGQGCVPRTIEDGVPGCGGAACLRWGTWFPELD